MISFVAIVANTSVAVDLALLLGNGLLAAVLANETPHNNAAERRIFFMGKMSFAILNPVHPRNRGAATPIKPRCSTCSGRRMKSGSPTPCRLAAKTTVVVS